MQAKPALPCRVRRHVHCKSLFLERSRIEGEALATLVVNRLRCVLPCDAVKAPAFGDRRKAMLEDIAILTGAKVIAEELGLKLQNVTVNDLGKAKRVVSDGRFAAGSDLFLFDRKLPPKVLLATRQQGRRQDIRPAVTEVEISRKLIVFAQQLCDRQCVGDR